MAPIIFEVQNKIDFTGLFSVKDSEDNHIECDGAKNEKIMAIVDDLPFDIVDTQNAN